MKYHGNRLLISYLIFVENWEKCRKMCRPAAVVMGALSVNIASIILVGQMERICVHVLMFISLKLICRFVHP